MEGMSLDAFKHNDLGDGVDIDDTLLQILKFASTIPLFELGTSRSTKLGTIMLLYNLKVKHGLLSMFLETLEVSNPYVPYFFMESFHIINNTNG